MEMRAVQLAARLTSMECGIPSNDILYSKFDRGMYEKLDFSIGRLINSDIYIDEKSTTNLDSIIASIRSMVKNYGIQGAVVDYIQLIHVNDKGMNREQQTGLISRKLKNLAKDLDIWIVALSQLSRDNSNPVPSIKRLRDSGQIEEACDVCMLIYRPEQIGRSSYPEPYENVDISGSAIIDVAKGRNIGTFKFLANFNKLTTHFSPFSGDLFQQNLVESKKEFTDKPF
jgi:replicative DNA helicase